MVGMEAIEVGAAQKLGVLRLQQKLVGGHAGVERGPDVTFDHLGVDELLTAFAGDADPVIAVLDEVDVTDLVELDWREIDVLIVGAVDVLPAAGGEALTREKLAVEILEAVHAADDLGEWYRLHAAVALALRRHPLAHLVVGNQIPGTPGEDGTQVSQEAVLPSPLEVVTDFALEWSTHGEAAAASCVDACLGSTSRTR